VFTSRALRFYLLSLSFFALGLMSKPMIVTLPLVLLLLDYWPLKRFELAALVSRPRLAVGLLVEKLPFVVLALLTSLLTLHAAKGVGSLPSAADCPMPNRMANVVLSYVGYFMHVFWPGKLAIYYPFPPTFSGWSVAGALLLLGGISVAAFCLARRWPYLVVGWLWYLATLLPVIGLIQLASYSHADRYTYVPLIGVFVGLTWGACELTRAWRHQVLVLSVAGASAIVLCLWFTRQQIGYWKDSEILYRHALAVTTDNWMAHNNLGNALDKKGQTDEAIRHYQEAIRLHPDYALAHNNLGKALGGQGQTDEAIRQFQETIRLKPDHADAHCNLGVALSKKGQLDEAIRQYQEAIRLESDNAQAYNNLGIAFYQQGRTEDAIRQFKEALRLKPGFADARRSLEVVLATKANSSPPPGTATNR
jgi:tetratricopeptide (TPR) repeat protein